MMKNTTIENLKNRYFTIKGKANVTSDATPQPEYKESEIYTNEVPTYKMHPNQYWASPHFFFHIPVKNKK
jgi:hypothetical protein